MMNEKTQKFNKSRNKFEKHVEKLFFTLCDEQLRISFKSLI